MENWNTVLQDNFQAIGWGAAAFLAVLYVLGNFVIVSLFTAILLANFGETAEREEEENKIKLAVFTIVGHGYFTAMYAGAKAAARR